MNEWSDKSKLEFYKNSITESGIDKVNYLEILKEYDLSELAKSLTYARIFISSISGLNLLII